jgi:molecular chaperone DnaJ
VRISQGIFAVQQTCPRCKGRGAIIKDPCPKCAGHGRTRMAKRVSVKVPAGVDNGDRIRLAGEGESGRNGGPPGDLYVEVVVREHPIFERDGAHLSCEVPISFVTAALGGSVEVPTLDGQAAIKVPAGTQSGRVFRLRDKGIRPVRGGATGDLFCRVVVETPIDLNADQKDFLKKFEGSLAADGRSHNPRQRSWLEGVRQFFGRMGG